VALTPPYRASRPVSRTPAESTKPVIVSVGETLWDLLPGGAAHLGGSPANIAIHAAALGAEAWLVSAVGNDPRGNMAFEKLDAAKVNRQAVTRIGGKATGVVHVHLDAKGRPSYTIADDAAWDAIPWSSTIQAAVSRAEAICFGTLAQRSKPSLDTIRHAVGATPPRSWRLLDVNLRQRFFDSEMIKTSLTLANAVKLNEEELPVVARLCALGQGSEKELLRALLQKFALRMAVLTRGPRGALLLTPSSEVDSPAPEVTVVDTVGAGDAFTAALLMELLHGQTLEDAAMKANAVAAYVCTQQGATPALPAVLSRRAPQLP
jgi:fructokinase